MAPEKGNAPSKKAKRAANRPTKLDYPKVKENFLGAIRLGANIETAVAFAGISRQTLSVWLKKGNRDKSGIYREFVDDLEKAFAECELMDLRSIQNAAMGIAEQKDKNGNVIKMGVRPDWKAAAFRLERRMPEKWGRRVTMRTQDMEESQAQKDNPKENGKPWFEDRNLHMEVVEMIEQRIAERDSFED